jgi:hypothetical protein
MNVRVVAICFVAFATAVLAQLGTDAQQEVPPVTDLDGYAVYAAVLPTVWTRVSKDPLLLQQEPEDIAAISRHSMELRDGKWVIAKRNGCGWIA